ncbi:MAG: copper resistance protein NlpE [Myxococcota bacterium]
MGLALGACALWQREPPIAATLIRPPAAFTGELPCADCAGIRTELDLRANGAWFMRSTYLEKGEHATHEAMGTFTLATDSDRVVLRGDREPPRVFRVVDAETIRLLDRDGREIGSTLNYQLHRVEPYRALKIVSAE